MDVIGSQLTSYDFGFHAGYFLDNEEADGQSSVDTLVQLLPYIIAIPLCAGVILPSIAFILRRNSMLQKVHVTGTDLVVFEPTKGASKDLVLVHPETALAV